jgi:hypothetical protein
MPFQISGLAGSNFKNFFELSDAQLKQSGMSKVIVDADFGYPDRISLEDVPIGTELILLNFEHQPEPSAFQSKGPIFVSRSSSSITKTLQNEIPASMAERTMSLRAYNDEGMMVEGCVLEDAISRLFSSKTTAYIHAHYALRGCFAARIDRA